MLVSRNRSDVDEDETAGVVEPEHAAHVSTATVAIVSPPWSLQPPPIAMRIGIGGESVKTGAPGCEAASAGGGDP
jgi:hypothetical protein